MRGRRLPPIFMVTQLRRDLEALFEELATAAETMPGRGAWAPAVDVVENPEAVVVTAEVPGLTAADLEIMVEGPAVTVAGRRRLRYPHGEGTRFHCVERQEGKFMRRLEIRMPVDFGRATARLADGLLVITLPRVEERRRRPRRLEIEESRESEEGGDGR
jgi:HSP20 family protein